MVNPLRRIPHRCLYCGRRIMGQYVCTNHRGVYESDPLGRTARLPLTDLERHAEPDFSTASSSTAA